VGCGIKTFEVQEVEMTGDIQEVEMTGEVQEVEITGEVQEVEMTAEEKNNEDFKEEIKNFDAVEVTKIETGTISNEVKSFISKINVLIQNRKKETKDEAKLTEEDIDLMENVIEELKSL
jgi:SMC interacting uncharacterized protein involved in chromosome segregation